MLTLGIDLASQATNTAACKIEWGDGHATPSLPMLGVTDRDVLTQAAGCDVIGIDAPFGWPQPFVELVSRRQMLGDDVPTWAPPRRDSLRFRLTDYRVRDLIGRWPLSVSSDLIAIAAMRCIGLLDALGVVDRSGDGRVFEVYPAAALGAWGFPTRGYKSRGGGANLVLQLEALTRACPWLRLSDDVARVCAGSDHAFDALIASLVARAAAVGLTTRPTAAEAERARLEGWIAVPQRESLTKLPSPLPAGR